MFEVWLKSLSGSIAAGDMTVTLQGSNDKLNWEVAYTGSTEDNPGTTVPKYFTKKDTTVIPYEFVRLRFDMTGAAGSPVVLLDASIRTFTTS